ncbi:hypothetical protein E2C01_083870 [Portunus trituberculatus]|uniref:Uncharacterized protein n=1 Tax=Portunus trituberculatus TaxID=210409 RepID=A0A5B7J2G8_PORTR|nr:hypothetical protein [Portunus trituberculatus]
MPLTTHLNLIPPPHPTHRCPSITATTTTLLQYHAHSTAALQYLER